MKRCKNCFHFSKLLAKNEPENKTKYLNAKVGECKLTEYVRSFDRIPKIESEGNIVSVSEWGDDTLVLVGIGFGCIYHKRKSYSMPKNSDSVLDGS